MRFGPQFSNLPPSVPQELYKEVKVKVPKPKFLESPNVDQKQLIRSIAKMLPEQIWHDPMVFPQRDSVLIALSQLSEVHDFIGGWLDSQFSCVPVDGMLALYNKHGEQLAFGDSGEIIHYAAQFCRRAIPAIVTIHRMGFVSHPKLTGVLHQDLEAFRKVRLVSPGLDRISKIEELERVDQDNTINKFVIAGLAQHATVYHLGAGTNMSSSQRALALVYERVVVVDPRCKDGTNSISATWQEVLANIPEDADIVSDVAYGDSLGMMLDGYIELVEELYKLVDNRLVMVKLPLQPGYQARGYVHAKPRPHNLEVVVVLDRDGDPLDDLYEEWKDPIITTNKERNAQLLSMAFMATIKDVQNSSRELKELILCKSPDIPQPTREVRTPKRSRNAILSEAGAKQGVSARRHTEWHKVLKNPEFDFEGVSVQLPPSFHITRGGMGRYDPGLPDVGLAFRSLRNAVIRAGYEVKFIGKTWQIC